MHDVEKPKEALQAGDTHHNWEARLSKIERALVARKSEVPDVHQRSGGEQFQKRLQAVEKDLEDLKTRWTKEIKNINQQIVSTKSEISNEHNRFSVLLSENAKVLQERNQEHLKQIKQLATDAEKQLKAQVVASRQDALQASKLLQEATKIVHPKQQDAEKTTIPKQPPEAEQPTLVKSILETVSRTAKEFTKRGEPSSKTKKPKPTATTADDPPPTRVLRSQTRKVATLGHNALDRWDSDTDGEDKGSEAPEDWHSSDSEEEEEEDCPQADACSNSAEEDEEDSPEACNQPGGQSCKPEPNSSEPPCTTPQQTTEEELEPLTEQEGFHQILHYIVQHLQVKVLQVHEELDVVVGPLSDIASLDYPSEKDIPNVMDRQAAILKLVSCFYQTVCIICNEKEISPEQVYRDKDLLLSAVFRVHSML